MIENYSKLSDYIHNDNKQNYPSTDYNYWMKTNLIKVFKPKNEKAYWVPQYNIQHKNLTKNIMVKIIRS